LGSATWLDAPATGISAVGADETAVLLELDSPGTIVGRYKLVQKIGEGGFGMVFLAEQEQPVRRRVALKIIKAGMDTKEVIARFEAERQALALMDHPNIAKVHDAGATENGRPYFVMELVQGVPITDYCDQCNLTTQERLELFITVCQTVQHAHQKGIIHRDLKPSNVLVTMQDGRPSPKIIDFGVAKAINQRLTEHTLITAFAQMVGTPMYMSPEQAELSPLGVDTRSDIYSLGVLLYQLLTSTTPFDAKRLKTAAYDELRRIIREEEPPRPSVRLGTLDGESATTVAGHHRTDSRHLIQTVRGDLDWIVMKAIEKDRTRRYETANGLAMDVQRHLGNEPVVARPPSRWYEFQKTVRRHKFGFAMAATVVAAMAVGLTAALVGFARASRERDRAERLALEETRQHQLAEANYQTAREVVDRMLTRLSTDLAGRPHMTQLRRALLEDALKFYQGFLEQKADDPNLQHAVAQSYQRVGGIYVELGQYEKSLAPFGQALKLLAPLAQQHPSEVPYREELAEIHGGLAYAGNWLGRRAESVEHARKKLALHEGLYQQFPGSAKYFCQVILAHVGLGNGFGELKLPQKALVEKQEALRLYEQRRTLFPNEPDDPALHAHICHWLGAALKQVGRLAEAEQQYRKTHELRTQLAAEHPDSPDLKYSLAHIKWYLAMLLRKTGRLGEAETLLRQAVALDEKLLEDYPDNADFGRGAGCHYSYLGEVLGNMRRTQDADAALRRGIEIYTRLVRNAPGEPIYRLLLADAIYELGNLLNEDGRPAEAAKAFGEAIANLEKLVAEHPEAAAYQHRLGLKLALCPTLQLRDPPRAVRLAKQTVQQVADSPDFWKFLGVAQYQAGDPTAAIEALQKSSELRDRYEPEDYLFMAMAHWRKGERDQARQWYDRAMAWIEKHHSSDSDLGRIRTEAETLLGIASARRNPTP